MINIISWNCRGAGGRTFPALIRDIRREYDANFLILLETHISGTKGEYVRNKIRLDSSFVVEPTGHSGGIWCLWDSSTWKVDVIQHNRQIVHPKLTGDFDAILHDYERNGGSSRVERGACFDF
ncbi:hypothetical protein AHAS_Ahas13G0145100 [Arachis hypogaea]|uniref:Endonuclease/exonuclease/phosphatase domain-containing protein n=1 Tax=Arachis hypogaea TaxID=3818 RepID=A0A445A5L6_ARAHY|nr:hypothetical protein Ahy_B03g067051 [Arachis hypogaea]